MSNPLIGLEGLPPFSKIKPEHVVPALKSVIEHCRKTIDTVLEQPQHTWDNFVQPLEDADDRLSKMWSPVSHMHSVVNNEELRKAYDECLPLISEYSTYVGQHQGLYQAYLSIEQSDEFERLSTAQQKTIKNALRDFKLTGIALDEAGQKRYGEISARLSELGAKFGNNVMDATQAWHLHVTEEADLGGLPESALALAAHTAQAKELEGWVFTLDIPSYLPIMTYADNRDLREQMYRAFVTRASDQGPNGGEFDNSAIMTEELALRHELALLLGFDSFADKSLATKMAETPAQVFDFLNDLAKKSKPQAQQEVDELRAFAKDEHQVEQLEAWDYGYYGEKLKQAKYAISDELLRPYFPADRVLNGLFETVNRLFGIKVTEESEFDSYHEDVRFFAIHDNNGVLRGHFYLDLYAREHKRGGAWMDDCMGRRTLSDGTLQTPVAYLVCNFNKAVGDKPALFTHNEVTTLFHEFGHGIHHMLTQIDAPAVAGINGVAWDAVELPSQFLENWCYEEEALSFISGHYESGEPLPKELLDKLLAAKNYQSAMQMLRQIEFSLFDFHIHADYQQGEACQIQARLNKVREQVAIIKAPEFNRFQHSFSHIFAGGYSAGYYSYKWAEVLSADAYSRFEEEGIFNAQTGKDFMENILEMGGSEEPMVLFQRFRGRAPQVDALLRHSGIGKAA
ncbi:oligopeptidase A [Pseudoalteromonas luteoviolacea]|uniref:oligopeptidase A n=1 Tax=Pseudoalteromonas luteoviolacea S4054 TaxID=1129367 RepID=A0A0F6A9U9_9GAMM|nr:oligopeptidase A [Pseudoalteromonas luteoviolacea]AOT07047.1 oligopeptidase A [Pseudoalteromonas luteoviolacea]AOT11965.1 oligopeptidase A [Pseudoalteromonas luteoviolacea]AOT16877.1 oligopeptidase A [Pseudoalteromonas luteoviolacea]KKE82626.1 oligopeptidase A [Pseudoalteromonas luteoviolacea S4054]KZN69940.1 oligopeptidase A [Pseudoalteromonas luteoviolacea S4047-1]